MVAITNQKSADEVVDIFCDMFNVSQADLMSRCRTAPVCECRMALYLFFTEDRRERSTWIGALLKRHHGAVKHGLESVREMLQQSQRFAHVYGVARSEALGVVTEVPITLEQRLAEMERRIAALEEALAK